MRFIAIAILLITSTALGRTWTDSTGKFEVEAEFVEAKDGKVTLEKEDGKRVTLYRRELSIADRKHIEELENVALKEAFAVDIAAASEAGKDAGTSAKRLLLVKEAVEEVIKKYSGKKVTYRWPISDVTEASDGRYRLSLGTRNVPPRQYRKHWYQKLTRKEMLAIDKGSTLIVSGTMVLKYDNHTNKMPGEFVTSAIFSNGWKLSVHLTKCTTKIENAKETE